MVEFFLFLFPNISKLLRCAKSGWLVYTSVLPAASFFLSLRNNTVNKLMVLSILFLLF